MPKYIAAAALAASTFAPPHHFRHHPECHTLRCARHADRLWARHHRRRRPLAFTGWAIPEAIVMCESKGTNEAPNGAGAAGYYQIIPSTWAAYGGSPPDDASRHSKSEQDAVAARIWAGGAGAGQWECKG